MKLDGALETKTHWITTAWDEDSTRRWSTRPAKAVNFLTEQKMVPLDR